ncbi:hypothetical protein [Pandoravirus japonicus]|uniref:Uncharacterized protein n=1 Tax=Pandoravirus japonicus TaxID=2823154 RepID=A0A811BPU5_9VIRU|nr:hypothetical protein [Pandoravirus japonicus]
MRATFFCGGREPRGVRRPSVWSCGAISCAYGTHSRHSSSRVSFSPVLILLGLVTFSLFLFVFFGFFRTR